MASKKNAKVHAKPKGACSEFCVCVCLDWAHLGLAPRPGDVVGMKPLLGFGSPSRLRWARAAGEPANWTREAAPAARATGHTVFPWPSPRRRLGLPARHAAAGPVQISRPSLACTRRHWRCSRVICGSTWLPGPPSPQNPGPGRPRATSRAPSPSLAFILQHPTFPFGLASLARWRPSSSSLSTNKPQNDGPIIRPSSAESS